MWDHFLKKKNTLPKRKKEPKSVIIKAIVTITVRICGRFTHVVHLPLQEILPKAQADQLVGMLFVDPEFPIEKQGFVPAEVEKGHEEIVNPLTLRLVLCENP